MASCLNCPTPTSFPWVLQLKLISSFSELLECFICILLTIFSTFCCLYTYVLQMLLLKGSLSDRPLSCPPRSPKAMACTLWLTQKHLLSEWSIERNILSLTLIYIIILQVLRRDLEPVLKYVRIFLFLNFKNTKLESLRNFCMLNFI